MRQTEDAVQFTGGLNAKYVKFDVLTNKDGREVAVMCGCTNNGGNLRLYGWLITGTTRCLFTIDTSVSYDSVYGAVICYDAGEDKCRVGFKYITSDEKTNYVTYSTSMQSMYNSAVNSSDQRLNITWSAPDTSVSKLPVVDGYLSNVAENDDFNVSGYGEGSGLLVPYRAVLTPKTFSVSKIPNISSSTETGYAYIKAKNG